MERHDPALELLGIEIEVVDGLGTAKMVVTKDMLNSHGICHGGILFLLADAVMDYTTNHAFYEGEDVPASFAAHAEVDYLRAAQFGDVLIATGSITHRWGRSNLLDATIVAQTDDTPIAIFRGRTRSPARK